MLQSFKYDVFLSYSSRDKATVLSIAERLKADGLRVWIDEWRLKPGDHIQLQIEEGLEQSRALVLCVSANAFASDWSQLEANTFRFRDPLNRERRFIPLRLDTVPMKGSLSAFLYINWYPENREQEYAKLLAGCRPQAQPVLTLDGHTDSITALRWMHQGSLLSTSYDGTVRMWDVPRKAGAKPKSRVLWESRDRILTIALRDDDTAAVSTRGGEIAILSPPKWDVQPGKLRRAKRSPTVYTATWLADGSLLTAEDDGVARITDLAGKVRQQFEGHINLVRTLMAFQDLNIVVTGSHDRSLRVWDLKSGTELKCRENAHRNDINALCRIDQYMFASSGDDGCIRLWQLKKGNIVSAGELNGHSRYVIELSVSRDRKILASKSSRRVCLWSLETQTLIAEIDESMEVSWPVGLAFHPRENLLATLGNEGRSIRIWKYDDQGNLS